MALVFVEILGIAVILSLTMSLVVFRDLSLAVDGVALSLQQDLRFGTTGQGDLWLGGTELLLWV